MQLARTDNRVTVYRADRAVQDGAVVDDLVIAVGIERGKAGGASSADQLARAVAALTLNYPGPLTHRRANPVLETDVPRNEGVGTAIMIAIAPLAAALLFSCAVSPHGLWLDAPGNREALLFMAADDEQPHNTADHVARGIERLQSRQPDDAIAEFEAAIAIDANNSAAFYQRGTAWIMKRDYDRAIADFDKVIALDPANSDALRMRGNLHHSKRNDSQAMADLDRAISLNPRDAVAYYYRGFVWISQRHNDKAIEDFSRAIDLDPKYSSAYVQRGQLYNSDRRLDQAMEDFTSAISADPNNAYAYEKRAEIWILKGMTNGENLDRAIADLELAVKANPANELTRRMLDSVRLAKQQLPDLLKAMEEQRAIDARRREDAAKPGRLK